MTSRGCTIRFIFNWIIKAFLVLALHALGLLRLYYHGGQPVDGLSWEGYSRALLVAAAFVLVGTLIMAIWAGTSLVTCGIAILLFPLLGGATLATLAHVMPNLVTTTGVWQTIVGGWLLMLIGIPGKKQLTHHYAVHLRAPR